jgi:hypothetical protein
MQRFRGFNPIAIADIFDQAKALSPQERKELAKLEAMEPIEFVDPDIEDPVEWVKPLRRKQHQRRLGD